MVGRLCVTDGVMSRYRYNEIVRLAASGLRFAGSGPAELLTREPEAVKQRGELAGDGDLGAFGALGFGEPLAPVLKRARPLEPHQHRVGRFVERGAQHRIARLGYMALVVALPRLRAARDEACIGPGITAAGEPGGIFDAALEGQRGDRPDAGRAHQPLADRIGLGTCLEALHRADDLSIERLDALDQPGKDRLEIRALAWRAQMQITGTARSARP